MRDMAAPGSNVKRYLHVRRVRGYWVVEMRVIKGLKTWMRVDSPELGAKYADRITYYKGKGAFNNKETASVGAAVLPEGGLKSFDKESLQEFIAGQFDILPQTATTTLPTPTALGNISTITAETSSCPANQYKASSSSYGTLGLPLNGNGHTQTVIEPSLSWELAQIMDAEEESSTGASKQATENQEAPATEKPPPLLENKISAIESGSNIEAGAQSHGAYDQEMREFALENQTEEELEQVRQYLKEDDQLHSHLQIENQNEFEKLKPDMEELLNTFDWPLLGLHDCTMRRSSLIEIHDQFSDDLSPI